MASHTATPRLRKNIFALHMFEEGQRSLIKKTTPIWTYGVTFKMGHLLGLVLSTYDITVVIVSCICVWKECEWLVCVDVCIITLRVM